MIPNFVTNCFSVYPRYEIRQ